MFLHAIHSNRLRRLLSLCLSILLLAGCDPFASDAPDQSATPGPESSAIIGSVTPSAHSVLTTPPQDAPTPSASIAQDAQAIATPQAPPAIGTVIVPTAVSISMPEAWGAQILERVRHIPSFVGKEDR